MDEKELDYWENFFQPVKQQYESYSRSAGTITDSQMEVAANGHTNFTSGLGKRVVTQYEVCSKLDKKLQEAKDAEKAKIKNEYNKCVDSHNSWVNQYNEDAGCIIFKPLEQKITNYCNQF